MDLYFRDNFFNAGVTEILNEHEDHVGHLDLKSAFGSSISVYGPKAQLIYNGRFPFLFSNKWEVTGEDGELVGVLRRRITFFIKKFTYETHKGDIYDIISPAFSREYEISNESGALIAYFQQISGWFSPGAFHLVNQSETLDSYELVAVILGMHAIQKRQRSAG